jgi:hypothetical protein
LHTDQEFVIIQGQHHGMGVAIQVLNRIDVSARTTLIVELPTSSEAHVIPALVTTPSTSHA